MLSDLLKAIELLISVVKGFSDSDRKKRKKLGKHLFRVYMDVESIVETGEELLELIESWGKAEAASVGRVLWHVSDRQAAIRLLRKKELVLEQAVNHFSEEELKSIVGIYAPEFRPIQFVQAYERKSKVLGLLWSQFTENDESALLNRRCKGYCYDCDEGYAQYFKERYKGLRDWTLIRLKSSESFQYSDRVEFAGNPEYISQYRDALQALRKIEEQLRMLLREKFSKEELL